MDKHDDVEYKVLAGEWRGNWKKFESFIWYADVENPQDCCHYVIRNNGDNDAITEANARWFVQLTQDSDDAWIERHSHWLVGWVEKIIIRVVDGNGEVTETFKKFMDGIAMMNEYPVIDDNLFDAVTCEMGEEFSDVEDAALPEGWRLIYDPYVYDNGNCPYILISPTGDWHDIWSYDNDKMAAEIMEVVNVRDTKARAQ